jgi:starch phosphorylase
MKAAMGKLAPIYNTNRMLHQYAEMFYATASHRGEELTADDMTQAKALSAWKQKLYREFSGVRIDSVSDNMDGKAEGTCVGETLSVEAVVDLGKLSPQDVRTELYYGPLGEDGQLNGGQILPMEQVGFESENRARYSVQMPCDRTGMTGYTVRVMPSHPKLICPCDMALIRWA